MLKGTGPGEGGDTFDQLNGCYNSEFDQVMVKRRIQVTFEG